MRSDYLKKIVWAVDAFEDREFQAGVLAALGALTRPTSAAVEPVHILTPPYTALNPPCGKPELPTNFEEAFRSLAEKRLFEFSKAGDIPTMSAGKVLFNHSASTKSAVRMLIDHAEKQDADAIVVATHARTGIPRFFLGSFAETLLLRSPVPVITVNPETKVRERINKILLPTTFGSRFRGGFERAAQLAKILDARLTVLYKEPEMPSVYMSPLIREHIIQEGIARAARAREWQDWAARFNVPVDVHIDNVPGRVSHAIAEYAKEKDFDLIAMVTQADPGSIPLIGSISREVVRRAPCPVWVMRNDENE